MITAQHQSICAADCMSLIRAGEPIEQLALGGWAHVRCPHSPDEVADQSALKAARCARCGLNHPGEC